MPQSGKFIAKHDGKELIGLKAWQEGSKHDLHSIEHTPNYGLTPLELAASFDLRPYLLLVDFRTTTSVFFFAVARLACCHDNPPLCAKVGQAVRDTGDAGTA